MTITRHQRRFGFVRFSGTGTATRLPISSKIATGTGTLRFTKVAGTATALGTAPTTNNAPVLNMPATVVLYANNVQPLGSYVSDPDGDAVTLEFGNGNFFADGAAFWTTWAPGTAYKVDNVIWDSANALLQGITNTPQKFKCLVNHTSSALLVTDATNWKLLGNNGSSDWACPNWPPGVALNGTTLTATEGVMPGVYGPFVIRALDNRVNSPQRWRKLDIDQAYDPFNSSKHTGGTWHPGIQRAIVTGGDHETGIWGQPSAGQTRVFPNGPAVYSAASGYRADGYSIDPYSSSPARWELEIPLFPRDMGGLIREDRPAHYDQCTFYHHPTENAVYLMVSEIRDQYVYRVVPNDITTGHNPWGSGSGIVDVVMGTGQIAFSRDPYFQIYKWTPDSVRNRGLGTWERVNARATWGGARHAHGQYHAPSDSGWAMVGTQFGKLIRYNHATQTVTDYGYFQGLPQSPGSTYVGTGASHVGFVDNFMYVVGWMTDNNGRVHGKIDSVLVKINLDTVIASGALTLSSYQIISLPMVTRYSTSGGYGGLPEDLKLAAANRKVVVIADYGGIPAIEAFVSHAGMAIATYSHDSASFVSMQSIPWPIAHAQSLFLPESNEIMLYGLGNTVGSARPERGTFATFYEIP